MNRLARTAKAARGRRLNPVEVEAYDVLPRHLARRARVIHVPWLPSDFKGMTLGRRVLLSSAEPEDGTSALLAHELVHVKQWHELGVVGFSHRYVSDFFQELTRTRKWKKSYLAIDAEAEARSATAAWHRRHHQLPTARSDGES